MPESAHKRNHHNKHAATYDAIVDNIPDDSADDTVAPEKDGERASTLSVLNVTYVVKEQTVPWWKGSCFRKTRQKVVLDDVSLQLKAGEMTAILGNSGSGKTSLLDVITCRSSGTVTGQVFYNNRTRTRDLIAQRATYVMQADRLLPNLTVRETLTYTAQLKLPGSLSKQEIHKKVTQVIMEMGLKEVADSRIGSALIRGISGGEQRRVTIAIQLLKDPDLVFLDEPTTGLDSYTARYLVTNLQQLARRGKIVLLTIHQPSSDIFYLFDQIGIMSQGHLVYFGPGSQLVPYFTSMGYPCDRYTNPLDRYVDVCSIDRRDADLKAETTQRFEKLLIEYKSSRLHCDVKDAILDSTVCSSCSFSKRPKMVQGPGCIRVFLTLLGRMYKNLLRDRMDYVARIFLLPFVMTFGLLFLGRMKHNQKSIHDRIGLLYQSCSIPVFVGTINSVALFPAIRNIYYRESRDGLYSPPVFLIAYTIHVLPFQLVSSTLFSCIAYWVLGMNPEPERFAIYSVEILILYAWGELVSVGFMGIFRDQQLAFSILTCVHSGTFIVSSGFLKKVSTMIGPLRWLCWTCLSKYTGEVFVVNEFQGLNFTCPGNATSCVPNGDIVLETAFEGADQNTTRNFVAQGIYVIITFILAILAYKLRGVKHLH